MSITTPSLEERVAALERQVEKLLAAQSNDKQKDWRKTIGIFTGDEVMWAIDQAALRYREEDRLRTREQNGRGECELS